MRGDGVGQQQGHAETGRCRRVVAASTQDKREQNQRERGNAWGLLGDSTAPDQSKDHQDQEFVGVISGVTEWGIYVEIIENKCEGMVRIRDIKGDYYIFDEKEYAIIGERTKKTYTLGDEVVVMVKSSDLIKRHLDFALIGKHE